MSIIESIKSEVERGEIKSEVVRVKGGGYTAYQLWSITVATFKAIGIRREKELTSQYVYNMCRQGMADGQTYKEGLKGVRFSEEDAERFVRKMVARNLQYLQAPLAADLTEDEEKVVEQVTEQVGDDIAAVFDEAEDNEDGETEESEDDETETSSRHSA
jgi:hypothetical protein